jgi:hypothetical protein
MTMNFRSSVITFSAVALIAGGQASAASKPKVNEVCLADFHKFCPSEELGRGVVIRCARDHLDAVAPDCKSAVDAANALNAARKAAKAAKKSGAQSAQAATEAPGAS